MKKRFTHYLPILVFLFSASALSVYAQVQTAEVDVKGPPESYPINGNIYPQFWKAKMNNQIAFVPLEKIISIGVQDYEIVGGGHVHELSIALEGSVMMRIYSIAAPSVVNRVKQVIKPVTSAVKGARGVSVPAVTPLQTSSVVKHYPETTHKPMMEFRVKGSGTVDKLFQELEKFYLDFKMRELVVEKRKDSVKTSTVDE